MNDIVKGISGLVRAFQQVHLRPPAVIVLRDTEEGDRFVQEIVQEMFKDPCLNVQFNDVLTDKVWTAHDGSTWISARVYGVTVRWPVGKYPSRPVLDE